MIRVSHVNGKKKEKDSRGRQGPIYLSPIEGKPTCFKLMWRQQSGREVEVTRGRLYCQKTHESIDLLKPWSDQDCVVADCCLRFSIADMEGYKLEISSKRNWVPLQLGTRQREFQSGFKFRITDLVAFETAIFELMKYDCPDLPRDSLHSYPVDDPPRNELFEMGDPDHSLPGLAVNGRRGEKGLQLPEALKLNFYRVLASEGVRIGVQPAHMVPERPIPIAVATAGYWIIRLGIDYRGLREARDADKDAYSLLRVAHLAARTQMLGWNRFGRCKPLIDVEAIDREKVFWFPDDDEAATTLEKVKDGFALVHNACREYLPIEAGLWDHGISLIARHNFEVESRFDLTGHVTQFVGATLGLPQRTWKPNRYREVPLSFFDRLALGAGERKDELVACLLDCFHAESEDLVGLHQTALNVLSPFGVSVESYITSPPWSEIHSKLFNWFEYAIESGIEIELDPPVYCKRVRFEDDGTIVETGYSEKYYCPLEFVQEALERARAIYTCYAFCRLLREVGLVRSRGPGVPWLAAFAKDLAKFLGGERETSGADGPALV